MNKSLFERNLDDSALMFNRFKARTDITVQEIATAFFGDKIAKRVRSYSPSSKKNAVILLGQSCSGKSTYAKTFLKEHPEFTFVSMDECAHTELQKYSTYEIIEMMNQLGNAFADDLGNDLFSNLLETNDNVLIDGGWVYLNARSALIKTLRQLGFHICIVSFLGIDPIEHQNRILQRSLHNYAANILGIDLLRSTFEFDAVQLYADRLGISKTDAINSLKSLPDFIQAYQTDVSDINSESITSLLALQLDSNLFYCGADEYLNIEF